MKYACVLGGSGTIGHQLVRHLKKEGYWVRSVDINHPEYSVTEADQFILLDLRNSGHCGLALFPPTKEPFDLVFMLAAQMGGAEFIFTKQNDAQIIYDSAMMNLNIANAASNMRINKIFFSSSACAYSEELQTELNSPALKEDTAWHGKPDSVYGIEKLFSESVYDSFRRNKNLNVRIGRFHNIFSPECHYKDVRAKAPAAICFKVAKAKDGEEIEIFGDGKQQRSFLFIDEAIEGVMRLMESEYTSPLNIGSEEMISINDFAKMVIDISKKKLTIKNIPSDATGVRGRNSDNLKIHEVLGWKPTQPLRIGSEKLFSWVDLQVQKESFRELIQNGMIELKYNK